jgi:ketopantoate reductase
MSQDLTDIVTMMLKVDANHDPSEANDLLSAGAREIKRLRAALAEIAEEMNAPIVLRGGG